MVPIDQDVADKIRRAVTDEIDYLFKKGKSLSEIRKTLVGKGLNAFLKDAMNVGHQFFSTYEEYRQVVRKIIRDVLKDRVAARGDDEPLKTWTTGGVKGVNESKTTDRFKIGDQVLLTRKWGGSDSCRCWYVTNMDKYIKNKVVGVIDNVYGDNHYSALFDNDCSYTYPGCALALYIPDAAEMYPSRRHRSTNESAGMDVTVGTKVTFVDPGRRLVNARQNTFYLSLVGRTGTVIARCGNPVEPVFVIVVDGELEVSSFLFRSPESIVNGRPPTKEEMGRTIACRGDRLFGEPVYKTRRYRPLKESAAYDGLLAGVTPAADDTRSAVAKVLGVADRSVEVKDAKRHTFDVHDLAGDVLGGGRVVFTAVGMTQEDLDIVRENAVKSVTRQYYRDLPEEFSPLGVRLHPSRLVDKEALRTTIESVVTLESVIALVSKETGHAYAGRDGDFHVWKKV